MRLLELFQYCIRHFYKSLFDFVARPEDLQSRSNSVHYNLSAIKISKSSTIRESNCFVFIYHLATNFRNNIWQNVKF